MLKLVILSIAKDPLHLVAITVASGNSFGAQQGFRENSRTGRG